MTLLKQHDAEHIWHPFTQHQINPTCIPIQYGEGTYLYDDEGKSYLDLVSSWWTNLHGHAHPIIAEAIAEQARILPHVMFSAFTHEPAVKLAELLKSALPNQLTRCFYSDNGSTAVETALKMSYQYWYNHGQYKRSTFLAFEGGYHGDTFGAMSVAEYSGFCKAFKKLFFESYFTPFPHTWQDDPHVEAKEADAIDRLVQLLEAKADHLCAFILEPLVQGSSGMRMCRPSFLNDVIEIVKSYGIIVIFDEVMTGFGRTGTIFAMDQVDQKPDIVCLSKGITGGFMPFAVTVATEEIFHGFLSEHFEKGLLHGHTFTANPLGCAAAIASFKLLQQQSTQDQIHMIHNVHHESIQHLANTLPFVKSPRVMGTIAAFNVGDAQNDYFFTKTHELKQAFIDEGLLIRPLGNVIYMIPPYCITEKDLRRAYDQIEIILKKTF